jgi:hypothetical protein
MVTKKGGADPLPVNGKWKQDQDQDVEIEYQ